jgi:dodecin
LQLRLNILNLKLINLNFFIMSVLKVIELLASSDKSWEDAAKNAVKMASKTIKEIRSVYIKEMSLKVKGNNIVEYRVNAKITFEVVE